MSCRRGSVASAGTSEDRGPDFANPSTYSYATLAGTRGFLVTAGVPFTANLVCAEFQTHVHLLDSTMTAVFSRAG